jgi:AraC-like DNA-binding protein
MGRGREWLQRSRTCTFWRVARGDVQVLTVDEIGTPLGRIVIGGAVEDAPAMLPRPVRVMPSYALIIVTEGEGVYVYDDGRRAPITAGQAIIVQPNRPHWYGPPDGERWSEIWAVFDGPLFDLLAHSGPLAVDGPMWIIGSVHAWGQRLRTLLEQDAAPGTLEAQLRVLALGRYLTEAAAENGPIGASAEVRKAQELLAGQRDVGRSMQAVAADVGLSYDQLRRRFTDEIGQPPAAYRRQRRVERAAALLRTTSLQLRQIAEVTGFTDEFHLSRRFKQHYGVPPSHYRSRYTLHD